MHEMWIVIGLIAIAAVLYAIEAQGPMTMLRRSMFAVSGLVLMATSMVFV